MNNNGTVKVYPEDDGKHPLVVGDEELVICCVASVPFQKDWVYKTPAITLRIELSKWDNKSCPSCKVELRQDDLVVPDNDLGIYHKVCLAKEFLSPRGDEL